VLFAAAARARRSCLADRHGGQPREAVGIEADVGAAHEGGLGGGAGVGAVVSSFAWAC
jgi:hypothetical protein